MLNEDTKRRIRTHGLSMLRGDGPTLPAFGIDCIDCGAATLHRDHRGSPLCGDCRAVRVERAASIRARYALGATLARWR